MSKAGCSISFVVPALNEEQVIEEVVRQIWTTVDPLLDRYEIILINDGSTDRTGEIMERLSQDLPNLRVLHHPTNFGLGASYQHGVKEARLDYVMMLCGDGGLPAASLPAIIAKVGSADIVVPYMTNLQRIKTPTRYLVSRTYTSLLNMISGHRLHYYNGLPVHRRDLLSRLTITSTGFGFQGEILVKLMKSGFSYVQVGVLGAECTHRTSAFRLKNVVSVATTLFGLVVELTSFVSLSDGLSANDSGAASTGANDVAASVPRRAV
ncbi:MAG: glycosyltransferase family 2 protein [Xanthobacteraceae bacterium]